MRAVSKSELHPDALLQRFIDLHRRTEGLKTAEKILTTPRGDDGLGRFLNAEPGNGVHLFEAGQKKVKELRSLLRDDVEKYAAELVLGAFGSLFSEKGHRILRDLSPTFQTLEDLAPLAALYEGFSSGDTDGWEGPRPWAGGDGD